jgi:DNA-binding GntR family transcriptional regulator
MKLRVLSGKQINPDVLTEIEHLDNQFHIQLINIHDLKQLIKMHDRKILEEREISDGLVSDVTLRHHENLFDDYQRLENTLHGIRQEFEYFVRQL